MDLVQIQHPYGMFLSCSSLGNNIAIAMTFKIHRTCSWESIGKIIYSFIDINRNIMMVCMMISGSAMIGGLGSYSRVKVFSHFNTLTHDSFLTCTQMKLLELYMRVWE